MSDRGTNPNRRTGRGKPARGRATAVEGVHGSAGRASGRSAKARGARTAASSSADGALTSRGTRRSGGARDPRARKAGGALADQIRQAARPGRAEAAVKAFDDAVSLLERSRDAAATAAALEAKQLAPRSGPVREVLGMALYRAGRFRDALRELQAFRRITGRSDQNHLIADCYRAIGAPDKGIPFAREAIAARLPEATRAEAAIVAASALADMGRYGEALSLLGRFPARRDVGEDWELRLWYVTGDLLERSGRPREAIREFRRILRHRHDAFDVAERLAAMGG